MCCLCGNIANWHQNVTPLTPKFPKTAPKTVCANIELEVGASKMCCLTANITSRHQHNTQIIPKCYQKFTMPTKTNQQRLGEEPNADSERAGYPNKDYHVPQSHKSNPKMAPKRVCASIELEVGASKMSCWNGNITI